jgi:hypothetical protein
MLIAIVLMLPITAGGFSLSYLLEADEPLLWRLAVGTVVGSAIFGTLAFILACIFGLAIASPAALVLSFAPVILFRTGERRKKLNIDWQRARNKMQGGSWSKFIRFAFYVFFFLLFCFFFSQAMYQTPAGIYTGGSQNFGDLPFHLGAIFSFTEGANFPPQNPSFAAAKFSYPFIADVATAAFVKLQADVASAMLVQNVAWAFSLLIILERFVTRVTTDRLAGKFAPWLLFFSGGLGFIWFLGDYWHQGNSLFDFLSNLRKDYTISDDFRWGNSLATLFITQRSLLLGMPLTLVVLQKLWEWFQGEKDISAENEKEDRPLQRGFLTFSHRHLSAFFVGLLAGLLPLVHLHSLIVLFVVTAFLFGLNPENWQMWIAFGLGVSVLALPELAWSITGTASRMSEFIDWHFGWDKRDSDIFWFWLKNTGLVIPMIALGTYVYLKRPSADGQHTGRQRLWLFYTPFLFLFIACNAAKFAPWEWDNIKVLIYWYVASIPLIALALAWLWRKGRYFSVAGAVFFAVLIFSGSLDVWRTVSGQTKYQVFGPDSVRIAELIKAKTSPNALFLNAATFNTAVVLTGRQSLMRYPGHLFSYGIDYGDREADVKKMYTGGAAADALLSQYNIDYVLISPEETSSMTVNKDYFNKYPVIAEAGSAKVYKIR